MTGFNQFKRALVDKDSKWYLAPEILKILETKDLRSRYDAQWADVFSLGLVCVETALQADIQDIYLRDIYQINLCTYSYIK
jgi:hypothetical protein